jgi:hypothetical protein
MSEPFAVMFTVVLFAGLVYKYKGNNKMLKGFRLQIQEASGFTAAWLSLGYYFWLGS